MASGRSDLDFSDFLWIPHNRPKFFTLGRA